MKNLFFLMAGIILLAITLTSCPDDDYNGIWLKNGSSRNVVVYIGEEGLGEPVYPDTLLPSINRTNPISENFTKIGFTKDIKNSKVCVFFLDQDTIIKYGWDKVRDDYMILKRYDVDEAYLRQPNVAWTIVYEDIEEKE
ncbi:hypothetical protein M2451_002464 [Dysgonomonas sp. PFB1-18]|uniref:hypothetical protein n=1 Tax=unclassified Dysgonomonas TaxID=2630389 RepID=UPI002477229A|nr:MULTISPECIES: hypothetical protein [unclassified Dysgonomonas]MDH6307231.1 hypothetical protein [Dysgonomonas sp. PF1-14]MDH6337149.1 hypothetical protein [Dysgonomonas sp. PF1-16]MDH6381135.1 hypothetical protein [Dysgonomonas sp. PFB1-18]MDH6396285.1 hypothetical protein [Dysgonomonas sp. PF1-23]